MKTLGFLTPLLFVAGIANAAAAETASALWSQRTSVKWSSVPLRESLSRFAELRQFGFVLDRRVDPSVPLEFEATNRELGPLLDELAASLDLGCVRLDSVVYLGPKESADLLPKLLAGHRTASATLPARWKTPLRRKVSVRIPFLGNPKDILETLAVEHGFRWSGLDALPHDLWDETAFSDTPLEEALLLLLIGFGRDYKIDLGTAGRPLLTLTMLPEEFQKIPATIRPIRTKKPKTGPSAAAPASKIPLAQRRFTLRVEDQRLDVVLQTLSQRLGLKLELDEASLTAKGISVDRRISFEVKNATAQESFRAALQPLKLEFRFRGNSVQIR